MTIGIVCFTALSLGYVNIFISPVRQHNINGYLTIKFLNIDNLNIIRNKLDLVLIEGLYDLINRNLSPPLPTNGENLHFAIEMSAMHHYMHVR